MPGTHPSLADAAAVPHTGSVPAYPSSFITDIRCNGDLPLSALSALSVIPGVLHFLHFLNIPVFYRCFSNILIKSVKTVMNQRCLFGQNCDESEVSLVKTVINVVKLRVFRSRNVINLRTVINEILTHLMRF